MRRSRRVFDVLQRIDEVDPNIGYTDIPYDKRNYLDKRNIKRDEMIKILGVIGEPTDLSNMNVPDLRDEIRRMMNHKTDKSGRSQFSSRELYTICSTIDSAERLDAEDIDIPWLGLIGEKVTVNGSNYTVEDAFVNRDAHPEAQYDKYDKIMLSPGRHRLMILHGLDTTECTYTNSVVLEQAKDYGPYKRWKKDTYVTEIET